MSDMPTQIDGQPKSGTQPATPSYAPPITAVAPLFLVAGDRYTVGEEIARGGMGAVYRATDAAFGREVAVKLLLHGQGADSPAAARFFDEARIAGQLQHPGIPPIYDVGTLPAGRPFLAMKLIKGKTLEAALKAGERIDAPAVFEAVCQAVGYAHARRVVHRDLKPANVMVGPFGEVQVMDWGLAKVLAASREHERPEGTEVVSRRADSDGTAAGHAVGSPQYMPPEQARGLLDEIDPRSDVFGLGGILCALLTGRPVYEGDSRLDTVLMASQADTASAFARLDASGVDPELVVLCKRCLAAKKADRPADGNAVAVEVAAYRTGVEDRLRTAERERAAASARTTEEQKRRRVQVRLGGLAVGVLLAGVTGTAWQATEARWEAGRANKEAERAGGEAKRASTEAANARAAEVTAKEREKQAAEARDAARGRYQLAFDSYNGLVFGIEQKLQDKPGTAELRRELLQTALTGLKKLVEASEVGRSQADGTLVHAHTQMGQVARMLGDTKQAKEQFDAAHELARRLSVADPSSAPARRGLATALFHLSNICLELGHTPDALVAGRESGAIRQELLAADPSSVPAQREVADSHEQLGELHRLSGDAGAAIPLFQAALAIRRRLAAADPTDAEAERSLSTSLGRLADGYMDLGDTAKAEEAYRDMMTIRSKLALANLVSTRARRDLMVGNSRMADLHRKKGDLVAAKDCYESMRANCHILASGDPSNLPAKQDLAFAYGQIGDVNLELGDIRAASTAYAEAYQLCLVLINTDPINIDYQRSYASNCQDRGNFYRRTWRSSWPQLINALSHYEEAERVFRELARKDSTSVPDRRSLVWYYVNRALFEEVRGDMWLATTWYEAAIREAESFHKPAVFADDVKRIASLLAECKRKAARELAPAPRRPR